MLRFNIQNPLLPASFTAMNDSTAPQIICIGELLIDLISTEYAADFASADTYQRLPGGSPANLAMNLARLGRQVELVATVGQDDAGGLLLNAVRKAGVGTTAIRRVPEPTTLILVTKSQEVSDFEPYRLADRLISKEQLSEAPLTSAKVLHTTAFALSVEPARTAILQALQEGEAAGARVSVDYNYADKIWSGDRAAGLEVFQELCKLSPLVKLSDVDYARLFDKEITDRAAAAGEVLDLGADTVVVTLGGEGCYVAREGEAFQLPARLVEVVDTTGAGDAFWSGFLAAYVTDFSLEDCAKAGRAMAERKLSRLGPVLERLTVEDLLS